MEFYYENLETNMSGNPVQVDGYDVYGRLIDY